MSGLLVPVGVLSGAVASAVGYIQLRGRVRLRWGRQLTDHSTFFAPYNVCMYAFSAVPRTPFVPLEALPALRPLAEHWETIRAEALRLRDAARVVPAAGYDDIAFNSFFRRGWARFYVKWYGEPLPSARALCPETTGLVESIPEINAALFALLPAGAKLGEHRDPFAGSLRYHLGLSTPNDDRCRIWVDGERYSWRDGEAVVFDETYVHRAANDTDTDRLILFCDVARPLRTPVVRAVNGFVARHLVPATATRNAADEPIGVVNRVARYVYQTGQFFRRLKKRDRRVYRAAKYALLLGAAGLAVWAVAH